MGTGVTGPLAGHLTWGAGQGARNPELVLEVCSGLVFRRFRLPVPQTRLQASMTFSCRTLKMARAWVCLAGAVFLLSCLVLHSRFCGSLVNSGQRAVGVGGAER